MATSRKAPVVIAPDALAIEKSEFIARLTIRVEKGKVLYDKPVNNVEELSTHEKEFYDWNSYNLEFLKQSFNNVDNIYYRDYNSAGAGIGIMFLGGRIEEDSPSEELKKLKQRLNSKIINLERLLEKVDLLKSDVENPRVSQINDSNAAIDLNKVFIVHGHNDAMRLDVARTLEKLGLIPIILNEQANAGYTLIEKFEANANVGFAIILLTDDDEGKSKTSIDLKSRARQNVVLELGYFIAKLGRKKTTVHIPEQSEPVFR